ADDQDYSEKDDNCIEIKEIRWIKES
ncbi:hypothetical protein NPIL_554571, partial [Nephila pilipes]